MSVMDRMKARARRFDDVVEDVINKLEQLAGNDPQAQALVREARYYVAPSGPARPEDPVEAFLLVQMWEAFTSKPEPDQSQFLEASDDVERDLMKTVQRVSGWASHIMSEVADGDHLAAVLAAGPQLAAAMLEANEDQDRLRPILSDWIERHLPVRAENGPIPKMAAMTGDVRGPAHGYLLVNLWSALDHDQVGGEHVAMVTCQVACDAAEELMDKLVDGSSLSGGEFEYEYADRRDPDSLVGVMLEVITNPDHDDPQEAVKDALREWIYDNLPIRPEHARQPAPGAG